MTVTGPKVKDFTGDPGGFPVEVVSAGEQLDRPQAFVDRGRRVHGHELVSSDLGGEVAEVAVDEVRGARRRVVHHLGDLLSLRRREDLIGLVVGDLAGDAQEPGDTPTAHVQVLALGVLVGVGGDDVDTGDHVGLGELLLVGQITSKFRMRWKHLFG